MHSFTFVTLLQILFFEIDIRNFDHSCIAHYLFWGAEIQLQRLKNFCLKFSLQLKHIYLSNHCIQNVLYIIVDQKNLTQAENPL